MDKIILNPLTANKPVYEGLEKELSDLINSNQISEKDFEKEAFETDC